jgi:hypothetical protein
MAHYLGDMVQSTITLIDASGNRVTGAVGAGTISADLYNPLNLLDGALVVAEIGATGRYYCQFTRSNPGAWKVLWACTSPVCSKVLTYDYRDDPALIAAEVDSVLSASHGAGSWETADVDCDYHTQPF